MGLLNLSVSSIGLDIVNAKLLRAAPAILAENRAMVTAMLAEVKPIVIANTPLGPGRFGYHLRDRFATDVSSKGTTTTGALKSPRTGYWREFGTGARHRQGTARRGVSRIVFGGGVLGSGGERAFMTAHKAASGFKRIVTFYYGGLARWWK